MRLAGSVVVAQAVAAGVVLTRVARGVLRRAPLAPRPHVEPDAAVSVVVAARNAATRIGPCLHALTRDPQVTEVLVVDAGSEDGTPDVAAAHGATVLPAGPPPAGWTATAWALQRGLEYASGEWVVALEPFTRPLPGLVGALLTAIADEPWDLLSVAPCHRGLTAGQRWIHPAMRIALVYRFGAAGAAVPPERDRVVAGAECLAFRREALLEAGGFSSAAGHRSGHVALARYLARRGWRVGYLDGRDILEAEATVPMAEMFGECGQRLSMSDITLPLQTWLAVCVHWLTLGLPPLRLASRRGSPLDVALLTARLGVLAFLRPSYRRTGIPYWLSPLADPLVALSLTAGAVRPPPTRRNGTV